ncbi:MAG: hypothetical protein R3C97_11970 [Geminicoccaceae bacterium]
MQDQAQDHPSIIESRPQVRPISTAPLSERRRPEFGSVSESKNVELHFFALCAANFHVASASPAQARAQSETRDQSESQADYAASQHQAQIT